VNAPVNFRMFDVGVVLHFQLYHAVSTRHSMKRPLKRCVHGLMMASAFRTRNECVYVSCGVRRPINDPGIPLHSTSEARHAYWLSPSAGRRRGHCQRPQVRIGAQGQSWVSCGHVQGVGVGVARCCCSCGCGCGWLLLPAVCEVLLVWLLVFLASMLTVQ
jgi:hypothetical protein